MRVTFMILMGFAAYLGISFLQSFYAAYRDFAQVETGRIVNELYDTYFFTRITFIAKLILLPVLLFFKAGIVTKFTKIGIVIAFLVSFIYVGSFIFHFSWRHPSLEELEFEKIVISYAVMIVSFIIVNVQNKKAPLSKP